MTKAESLTHGSRSHFFGYYDKTPWSGDGRRLLALETTLPETHLPGPEETATVGMVDLAHGNAFIPLAQTRVWNWQQGCMLQWLHTDSDRSIVYNDREKERLVTRVRNLATGEERLLPRPIYSLSRSGTQALSLDFARLRACRPVTGYATTAEDSTAAPLRRAPEDDGIWHLDIASGESRLILSFATVADAAGENLGGLASPDAPPFWFEHLIWNTDDSRFLFLLRYFPPGKRQIHTVLFTARPDGSGLFCVSDHGMVSHFDWQTPERIVAWAYRREVGERYFVFTDQTDRVEVLADGILTRDGHCSFSPDGRWLLTDEPPDANREATLLLYHMGEGRRIDLGRFYQPPHLVGDIRCDLHPRWNRDGTQVCIDSAHEGGLRQIYVQDVSDITTC